MLEAALIERYLALRCVRGACVGCSVWEQSFIYFKQRFLIVYKQIKQVALVSYREVSDLDPVLGKLRQL